MAKYIRAQAVPKFQFSAATGRLFKWLPPESKDRVFSRFDEWFSVARERGAAIPEPRTEGLNEQEIDTLLSMCADAAEGIVGYWNECNRNAVNRNSRSPQVDHGSTADRPMKEGMKEGKNEPKKMRCQQYKQREYNEEEMQKTLGVDDLYKEEDNGQEQPA